MMNLPFLRIPLRPVILGLALLVFYPRYVAAGLLPREKKLKIMCLGDSITHGQAGTEHYRNSLWKKLQRKGHINLGFVGSHNTNLYGRPDPRKGFDKDHEGHGGWRADHILWGGGYRPGGSGRLDSWMFSLKAKQQLPDIVLIHIGTNDVTRGGNQVGRDIYEIRAIINKLRAWKPEVDIILAKIIPHRYSGTPSVNGLNAAIQGLGSYDTAKSKVYIVDMHTGFSTNWLVDKAHPNVYGASVMSDRWIKALRRPGLLLPTSANIHWIRPEKGLLKMSWSGQARRVYQVQGTRDMKTWVPVKKVVSSGKWSQTYFPLSTPYVNFRMQSFR